MNSDACDIDLEIDNWYTPPTKSLWDEHIEELRLSGKEELAYEHHQEEEATYYEEEEYPDEYSNETTFALWLTTLTNMLQNTTTLSRTLDPIQWVTLRETIDTALTDLRRQRLLDRFRIQRIITKRSRGACRDFLVCWEDCPHGPYSWVRGSDFPRNHPKLLQYNVETTLG